VAQSAEICHVSDARRFLPAAAPLLGARMTLHPFDHDTGRELARRQLDIGPTCFVVLALTLDARRLTPCVGIDTVILGVARLRQRHGVDVMLLVAAGAVADVDAAADAELARLRELVRALAMKPHVRFLTAAPMNVLRDCHAAANVLVSTPWRAANGGSAGSNGRGAVCNGLTGAVLPPHDAEALAACLARLQRLPRLALVTVDAALAHLADLPARHKPAFQ
jgi:D-inositol-3-phosphate glycosyltransferase